jgi:hypothetical protein
VKTAVGVLDVVRVAQVERSQITERDAARAGCSSLSELLTRLDARDGEIYRIDVRFAGEDPRIALRQNDRLSGSEVRAGCGRRSVGGWDPGCERRGP